MMEYDLQFECLKADLNHIFIDLFWMLLLKGENIGAKVFSI